MKQYFDMRKKFLLEVPISDKPFLEDLQKQGHEIEIVETSNLQGINEIVEAIVKLSAALTPILALFLSKKSSSSGQKKITIDGKKKVFENYTAKEIQKLLEDLKDEDSLASKRIH
ncbi:hypothetical protein [Pedobacter sp. GR22-10]|uniref:hypothetical protein n=1 Tax=Pedobacter sp. GR22-10 TaxID=2994472 RepID=UPI002246AB4F|nr:hypothetical protein [Pedobacter sp. GR22-10]MCX2429846.1 hypothetical protein [Pedobacter sp. GR22-10]